MNGNLRVGSHLPICHDQGNRLLLQLFVVARGRWPSRPAQEPGINEGASLRGSRAADCAAEKSVSWLESCRWILSPFPLHPTWWSLPSFDKQGSGPSHPSSSDPTSSLGRDGILCLEYGDQESCMGWHWANCQHVEERARALDFWSGANSSKSWWLFSSTVLSSPAAYLVCILVSNCILQALGSVR